MLREEGGDSGLVLGEPGNEMEELNMPGNNKGSGGLSNPGLAGDVSSGEHGSFKSAEDLPRVDARTRVDPASRQGGSKGGRLSHPLGNAGKCRKKRRETVERKRDGKMVRKASAGGGEGTIIGGVVKDGDVGGDKRVGKEGRGDKKAIKPRGPGVSGQGVRGEVEVCEGRMRHVGDGKPCFETGPERKKRRRGRGEGACGVLGFFNEIEVTAEEGGDGGVNLEHRANQVFVDEGFTLPRFEVDVEKLKRLINNK